MANDAWAVILGRTRRDPPPSVASRTAFSARHVVVGGRIIAARYRHRLHNSSPPTSFDGSREVARVCWSHAPVPLLRREHNRSLSHRRLNHLPTMSSIWRRGNPIASIFLQRACGDAGNKRQVQHCCRQRETCALWVPLGMSDLLTCGSG